MLRYTLSAQFMARLPIPNTTDTDREAIGGLAMAITEQARARYGLHQKVRRRLVADLGTPGGRLNTRLTAWWTRDLPALRAELHKAFGRDIPLKDRDDWDDWLTAQKARHQEQTARIAARETDLNARVYALLALTPDEITVIEDATKYHYGKG